MTVPYAFASATTSIPLSQLDANFNTAITLGNTAIQLGNTVTTLNNMTLANATVSSGNVTVTSASLSGNLTFTGTGNRITGDFSNATTTSRVSFQSSTTNGATVVQLIPNGTSTATQVAAYGGSDILNTSVGQFTNNGTEVRVASGIFGTGTYLPMTFYTGGSERMRVDTSGNVGIGTSSPSSRLHTRQDQDGVTRAIVQNRNGSGTPISEVAFITGAFDLSDNRYAYIQSGGGSSTYLAFGTGNAATPTERARIDSSGRLLLATTTTVDANAFMSIRNVNGTTGGIGIGNSVGSSDTNCITFFNSNGQVGRINTSGGATGYVTSSDYRLKHDVQPIQSALEKVALLKPVTYRWNADNSSGEGFIAHELAEVCPGAVYGEKDAVNEDGSIKPQGIDTSFLVATLAAAIQELKAELDATKAEVAALKGA